jgi:hypothetical protein
MVCGSSRFAAREPEMIHSEPTQKRTRMRATLVRFGDAQYEEVKAEARLAGVSVAEFVRQAVTAWTAHHALRRDAVNGNGTVEGARDATRRSPPT